MLDPFVPLLTESLASRHVRVLSRTLHCLTSLLRLPLPSIETHVHTLSDHLLEILKKYARVGAAAVTSNRELAIAAFKVGRFHLGGKWHLHLLKCQLPLESLSQPSSTISYPPPLLSPLLL